MSAKTKETSTQVKTIKEAEVKEVKVLQLIPRATEKTYAEQAKHTYAFFVPLSFSKQAVATQVAKQFSVTVTDVRVLTRKGKATRFSRGKHAYPGTTYRRDHKLAYVTLKDGDKIAVFEEEQSEPAKPEEKAEKSKKGDK